MIERSKGSPSGSNRAAWPTEKTCVLEDLDLGDPLERGVGRGHRV